MKLRPIHLRGAEGGTTERGGNGGLVAMIRVVQVDIFVVGSTTDVESVGLRSSLDLYLDGGCGDGFSCTVNGLRA